MDPLDKDALDVGGFRRACDPDYIRVGRHRGDRSGKVGENLLTAQHRHMHPRSQRTQPARSVAVGEDQCGGQSAGSQ